MTSKIDQYRRELEALAESLPFFEVDLPSFHEPGFAPVKVRQPREYVRVESGMQAISRFLVERGVVGILSGEQIVQLFTEIHYSAYCIRKLAAETFAGEEEVRTALVEARRLISAIEAAEEELFIANRRLVVACAKPFYWIGQVWIGDFLQEGSKALTNAVRKFDLTRGTPFYSYAQRAVQNRLRNYFRDHVRAGTIGIRPTREMELLRRLTEEWGAENNGQQPDVETLVRLTGLPEARVRKLRPLVQQWTNHPEPAISLDALLGDSDARLHDFLEDEQSEPPSLGAQRSEVWEAIERLPARAKYIMQLRYVEGLTLEEAGERVSLTRARIKQIQDESLRKLRQMLQNGVIDPNM